MQIGISMMSRGEMSFIINQMGGVKLKLLDEVDQAAVQLVVLMSIFLVPVMLTYSFKYFAGIKRKELLQRMGTVRRKDVAALEGEDNALPGPTYYRIIVRVPHTFGLLGDVMNVLHELGDEVLDFR